MSLKKIFIGFGIIFFLVVFYFIYQLSTFSLFEEEIKVIKEIRVPNKKYLLRVYYVPSNATTQSYIQVRKVEKNTEFVLQSYERFNYLNSYKFIGRDTLNLSISDTSFVHAPIEEVKFRLQ